MRFLLINPFYPISESPSPPLGLAFLAAALERAGIEVRILDLVVYPYDKKILESVLNEFAPDMAGATAVTMSFNQAMRVIKDIKDLDPGIITVMGGPHVTFRFMETMRDFPALDFIVLGEGEEAVVQLARAVDQGRGWEEIAGLVFRDETGLHRTAPRPPGIDLDSLPTPARHLLPLGRYRALGMAISMTTSRGCPHQCIFCVGRKMVGSRVRYRDPIKVVDELEYLSTLGFPQVNLADDLFTANKRHCLAVCREIMKRNLRVKWTSFARVDTVSPEVLVKMKEAGCSAVSFGVESGNQEILRTIKKGITLDQVIAAVEMCTAAGLTPHASFILGLPGETPETLAESVNFGEKLKNIGVSHGFHLLAPFPGTAVREEHEAYGLKILTDDWDQYHANRAIVETPSVSREMLDRVVIKWEEEFDGYLGYIKKRMEDGQATAEEAWPLINLERIVIIYDLMMERIIEDQGVWPVTDGRPGRDEAFEGLVKRLAATRYGQREYLTDTLKNAFDNGHLRFEMEKENIKWAWVDYLSS